MALITYTNKVENGGTTADGLVDADDMNEIKTKFNANEPFSKYVFQLTQTGTGAPTITQLQNNTGLTFIATRDGVGQYAVTPNTPPTAAKVAFFGGTTRILITYDGAYFTIESRAANAALSDAQMTNTPFEIRIYP